MAFSTLTGAIRVDASGVKDGVDEAEQEVDSLTGRMESAGQSMQSAGATMTAGVTAPLLAMGAASANAAADFDQAMQQSIAVMGDVDEAMREDLEATARDVANTTTVSAQEAADAYYYLASAGLDATQSMEAMPRVAEFAEAGQMQMAEATDVATNVMSAFGYQADEMTEVTDTLTATVSNHNQTMQGMSSAMSKVAPVASSLGLSIEETSAAIGQMGDVGIQGERAGTALRNVMSQLSDESSTVTKQLRAMGVQTRDSQGNVLSLTQILQNMEQAGIEAGDAAQIFGTEAGPAMAALMQEGSSALAENTARIQEAEGATQDMAETQRETLNAEMQMARSNIEDAGIAIGTVLMPMLSTLTGYVQGAAQWFQGLNSTQQKAIVVTAGLAAAIGPLLLGVGTLLAMLPAMSAGYATATATAAGFASTNTGVVVPSIYAVYTALGPIGWALGALALATGALAAAWKTNFGNIRGHTEDGVNAVLGLLESLVDRINKILPERYEIDFEANDVDLTSEASKAEEEGEKAGEAAGSGFEDAINTTDFQGMGEDAGSEFGAGLETGAQNAIGQDEAITAEPTDAVKQALVEGVDGYKEFDDASEVEDAPTKINEELFDALARTDKGATADRLGVSEREFQMLKQRFTDGGAGSTSTASGATGSGGGVPADLLQNSNTSGDGSGSTLSAEDIAQSIRDALEGLHVQTRIRTNDQTLDDLIQEEVEGQLTWQAKVAGDRT